MKSIVIYFSRAGYNYVNGQIKKLTIGNVEIIANKIAKLTNSDTFKIEQVYPYSKDYSECIDEAKNDQRNDARPELKNYPQNLEKYDVIYLGYPNYWGDMPMIIYTFLEQYNFDGKTIIPFNTHGGSGLSSTVRTITNKLSNSTVINDAFTLSRNNMESAPEEVSSWLKEIGITK